MYIFHWILVLPFLYLINLKVAANDDQYQNSCDLNNNCKEEHYVNLNKVDIHKSLEIVNSIDVNSYELKTDKISGKRHVGFILEDVKNILPESVNIIPGIAYHHGKKIEDGNVETFDKNHLFAHNFGATKALFSLHQNLYVLILLLLVGQLFH